jgi:hypothetical protein
MKASVLRDPPEPTDPLFDTSNAALAERFGARVRQLAREGRDVTETARLAFSYANLALAERTHQIRQSPSQRKQAAIDTIEEHIEVCCLRFLKGQLSRTRVRYEATRGLDAALAILRGEAFE